MKSTTLDIVAQFPTLQLVSEVRPEVCIMDDDFFQFGCALLSLLNVEIQFLTFVTGVHVR